MKKILLFLAAVAALAGCKGGTKTLLPNVSGKAGEIIVVIDKDNWEGALGSEVRALLADECPYLAQKEPLYSLVNVTPGGFADLFRVHRNIIMMNVGAQADSAGVVYLKDIWAAPQCVIQVSGKTPEECQEQLQKNGKTIQNAIEQAERNRVIANTIKYEERDIAAAVKPSFGGSPHFPIGYKLKKATSSFIWIADDKQYTMQDILMYRYPVGGEAEPLSEENLLRHRNEILKDNVPGMFEGSWMTTSANFPVQVEYNRYRGRDFAQMRGYWEVENDFMGGPFVSHSFYSRDGSEIIVLDAFVYAPRYDKRQYLRQVESILYSWEWAE